MISWISPEIGQPGQVYGGQRVAGLAPQQLMAMGLGGMLPGGIGAAQGQAMGTLGKFLGGDGSSMLDPVYQYGRKLWSEDIVPSVMERFAGMGTAASGGAQKALSRAGERFGLGMMGTMAPMELQARGQQLQAVPMAGDVAQWQIPAIQSLMGLGGVQRGVGEQQLGAQAQQWQEAQPYANPMLQFLGSVLPYGAPAFENIVKPESAGMGYSLLTGMAPGVGQGMGQAGLGGVLGGMGNLLDKIF